MSDAILMGQSGMNIHGDKFTGNGKGISITAKNGDFVTTGSGELKTGSFGETSQMLSTNGNACWLNKEYGLYCNQDENPIIKPFRRSSSDPLAIEWIDSPSLTVTSLEYYQSYHVPCLARLNDTMAILFYESCAEWGSRGSGLSIHVIKYDGSTITKVSEQYVAHFISHGSDAYPTVQVVNDGNDYKVLFVAGWPDKELSDSSYIDGIGMIIFKITSDGTISILGQQSHMNGDTLSKNAFYDSVNQNFWIYYSYYSHCISLTNYTLTSKHLDSQTDGSITNGQSLIYKNYLISCYGDSLYAHNWSSEGVAETRIANLALSEYSGYENLAFFSKENSFYMFLSNKSESKIVLIEFDFDGSTFIKKSEDVICDFDISYGSYGTGRTRYNPVLNFEDEFLLDGTGSSSSGVRNLQCALILTTKYNFIKSTKSALGIKKNSNTVLLIPGLS